MTDAEILRAWRRRNALTQAEAAALLRTPYYTYRRWEAGREPPACLSLALERVEQMLPRAGA